MPVYRFAFHAAGERLVGEERRALYDDEAAAAYAETLADAYSVVMVWRGAKFVKRLTRSSDGHSSH